MANKKATIYILNISNTMGDQFPIARDTIIESLEDKLLAAKKTDLAAVLLVGTEETNNILNDQTPDQYEHITQLSGLAMPQLEMLRALKKTTMTDTTADVLDAVIIANQMIVEVCRKLKYTKKIVVFSDNSQPIDWLDLDAVADMLSDSDTELTVVASDYTSFVNESCSDTVKTNCESWKKLAEGTREGELMSLAEAYELAMEDSVKEVRPTPTYRGYLYLGTPQDSKHFIGMHIFMYLRSKEVKLPSGKKYSVLGSSGSHQVEKDSKYMIEKPDDQEIVNKDEPVEKESLVKAYRFGKSIVKLTEEEITYRKLKTHKEMTIIGFVPKSKFPRHYLLANALIITAGNLNTEESALGLKALAHAMHESDSLALVRYVFRDDAQPKIGILQPEFIVGEVDQPETDTFLLHFFQIAFAEDIRDFKFKSLRDIKEHDPKGQEMMDKLVDSMNLDDVGQDYLIPDCSYNPFVWRMNKAIKNKALDPDAPVPDMKPSFQAQFEIADKLKEKVGDLGEEIQKYYKVKKIKDKKKEARKTTFVEDITTENNIDDVLKNVGGHDNEDQAEVPVEPTPSMPSLSGEDEVMFVGMNSPVEDFRALLNKPSATDTVEPAMKGMTDVIKQLLQETFGGGNFGLIIECLKELRKAGATEDAASIYNHFIREFKALCEPSNPSSIGYGLWVRIKNEKLGLITNEECDDTDIANTTREVAEKFYNDNDDDIPAVSKQPKDKPANNDNEFDINELDDMF